MRRWFAMILTALIAGSCGVLGHWGYAYISYVQPRVPGPSMGRLTHILVQVPALWYAYATGGLFLALVLVFVLGRSLLWKAAKARAQETLHWKTREAWRWWRGEARRYQGLYEEKTAEFNAMSGMAREFQSQLLAIDQIRSRNPRNEIAERRLIGAP